MEEVQQATSMLLLSQTKVVTLRQRVSDTEGHIAALNETKQLAVAGEIRGPVVYSLHSVMFEALHGVENQK